MLLGVVLCVPLQAQDAEPAPSSTLSLDRIRLGLVAERPIATAAEAVDFGDTTSRRPRLELFDDFDVVVGVEMGGALRGPAVTTAVTHQEMLAVMTPRDFVQGRPSDALGAATGSLFAVLLPRVIQAVSGWFGGGRGNDTEVGVLTKDARSLALALARANRHVLDADLLQRGHSVILLLTVRSGTSRETAHALGEHLRLVIATLASDNTDTEPKTGQSDFDYVVRISSSSEPLIALGIKAVAEPAIRW